MSNTEIHITEDFFSLLVKYLKMETNQEENVLVESWLSEDEKNPDILLETSNLIFKPGTMISTDINNAWVQFQDKLYIKHKRKTIGYRSKSRQLAWAAAIFLFLGIGFLFKILYFNEDTKYYKGAVAIQLKDGTKVQLEKNAELILSDNFNGKNRTVALIGDGSFTVAKDSTKPFVIQLNKRILTVLGTAFKITQKENENYFHVKVTEGVVKVKDSSNNKLYKLIAGQELMLSDKKDEIKVFQSYAVLNFKNVSLIKIINELEKVYRIKFIGKEKLSDKNLYTIDLSSETLDNALKVLSALTNIKIDKIGESDYFIKSQ